MIRYHRNYAVVDFGRDFRNGGVGAKAAPNKAPTFYKDVLPILQNHCQECHRPGEIAPMALMTYQQTRPWAKAIKTNALEGKMPPWPADPHFGKFANDRSLIAGGARYAGCMGRFGRGGRPQIRRSSAEAFGRRLEYSPAGRRADNAGSFQHSGQGNDRVSIRHHPQRIHRRQMDAGGGSAALESSRGASRGGVPARAGFAMAGGGENRSRVRARSVEPAGALDQHRRRRQRHSHHLHSGHGSGCLAAGPGAS